MPLRMYSTSLSNYVLVLHEQIVHLFAWIECLIWRLCTMILETMCISLLFLFWTLQYKPKLFSKF